MNIRILQSLDSKRATSYTNLCDPSIGLMRGKDSHGQWRTPFDPHFYNDMAANPTL